jgi:hypothetical protein
LVRFDGFWIWLQADATLVAHYCEKISVPRDLVSMDIRDEQLLVLATNPSSWSFLSFPGTLLCHHFQSLASRPNFFPDEGVINVESYDAFVSQEFRLFTEALILYIDVQNRKLLFSA